MELSKSISHKNENAHKIWWSSLSINEQNYYVSIHPFFGKMGMDYFYAHKTSMKQVYDNVMENDLVVEYEYICELYRSKKLAKS